MHIFLTGGNGFIGKHVMKDLLSHGHTVLALARTDVSAIALAATGAQVHLGDIKDLDCLREAVKNVDAVIHLAYGSVVGGFEKASAVDRAAIAAMGGALGRGKPLLIASETSGVDAGEGEGGGVADEDSQPDGTSFLKVRHLSAEMVGELCREKGVKGMIVRLAPLIHGRRDTSAFIPEITAFAKKNGRVIYIKNANAVWPAVHVADAASLFRLAMEKDSKGAIYNAVGEEGVAVRDLIEVIGQKVDVPVEGVSAEEARRESGVWTSFLGMHGRTSSEKTRRELGWVPMGPGVFKDMEDNYVW